MSDKSASEENLGCFWLCNIWLFFHALLQLLMYFLMLYCGLCSFLLPLTFYIICCLAGSVRQYVLLNVPIFLFIIGAFMAHPVIGGVFGVQWFPCFIFGLCLPRKRGLAVGWWGKTFLYLLALLPYMLMVPYIVWVWRASHS